MKFFDFFKKEEKDEKEEFLNKIYNDKLFGFFYLFILDDIRREVKQCLFSKLFNNEDEVCTMIVHCIECELNKIIRIYLKEKELELTNLEDLKELQKKANRYINYITKLLDEEEDKYFTKDRLNHILAFLIVVKYLDLDRIDDLLKQYKERFEINNNETDKEETNEIKEKKEEDEKNND